MNLTAFDLDDAETVRGVKQHDVNLVIFSLPAEIKIRENQPAVI